MEDIADKDRSLSVSGPAVQTREVIAFLNCFCIIKGRPLSRGSPVLSKPFLDMRHCAAKTAVKVIKGQLRK